MSGENFLEKLLDGVEVEWKALGDVAKYSDARIDFNRVGKENYVGVDNLLQNRAGKAESNYVPTEGRPIEYLPGDILIGNIRPYLKKIWLANQSGGTNGDVLVIRPTHQSLSSGYLHQVLTDENFFAYNMQHAKGAKMPRGDKTKILEYRIPIPCPENPKKSLEIQAEIVRILDTFAELTTELTARKKQYNHYRDQLLSFDLPAGRQGGAVEWKTLPEVALDFGRGKSKHRPRNDVRLYGGDIPFIQTGDIRSASHIIMQYSQKYSEFGLRQSKLWPKGTLCITIAANIAETSILGFDACFPDSVIGFVPDPDKTSAGYVEYLLQSTKKKLEDKGKEKSSAQSNINLATFEQLKLPFPSPAEQARIVAILDKFDALTNSITEGLPREIALRQKQYEYYRDLLLSFPKQEEVAA
jgi:type I restriction enzyme S subunit